MNRKLLSCVVCPSCGGLSIAYNEFSSRLKDGVLKCRSCNSWYIVEGDIAELVRDDLNHDRKKEFYNRYKKKMGFLRLKDSKQTFDVESVKQKKSQMNFFDDFSGHYILETHHFWKAYYALFFDRHYGEIREGSSILDLGCGSGLASLPLLNKNYNVIGVDISREMLKRVLSRLDKDQIARHSFIVADAENLPFRHGIFDVCIGMGILHHVHSPKDVVVSVKKCLKKDGVYLGHENNKTPFRLLFNLLMKLSELWHEEAGEEQFFSAKDLDNLFNGFTVMSSTHAFLPPHIFKFFSEERSKKILRLFDDLFGHIPLLKNMGGAIAFKARKL